MGVYTAYFSGALVILQTTLLLLNRAPQQWAFSLVQHQRVRPDWAPIERAFADWPQHHDHLVNLTADRQPPLRRCLLEAWDAQPPRQPAGCRESWPDGGAVPITEPVLAAFNPHIIVLAVACMHFLICLSGAKRKHHQQQQQQHGDGHKPEGMTITSLWDIRLYKLVRIVSHTTALTLLAIIVLVVAVLSGIHDAELTRYPTIITVVLLFAGGSVYAYRFDYEREDLDWTLAFHMQIVGVPLTVVVMAAMGVRFWIYPITHCFFLIAAVNCMWIQFAPATDPFARQIARFATVAFPTFTLCATQQEWGTDSWEHVVTLMAAASLAPLFILTLYQTALEDGAVRSEEELIRLRVHRLRITHLFTTGALLSTIANLAMF